MLFSLQIFAWVTYILFHGSDPGYITTVVSHEQVDITADADELKRQREVEEREETDRQLAAEAGQSAGALIQQIMAVRSRASPSSQAAAAAAPDGATALPSPGRGGGAATTDASARGPPSAWEDAYVDYDAADGSAASQTAAADAAQRGERPCAHCRVTQPARAHHCKVCDRCVATFDHHCGVVGTCVGERNRCRFWFFLLGQVCVLAFMIGILNSGFVYRRSWGDWAAANIVCLVALLVLWILQALLLGMLGFHSWLAATNTTTFETVTGADRLWYLAGTNPQDCDLPYSRGLSRNLRSFCCILDGAPRLLGAAFACGWRHLRGVDGWTPTKWESPGPVDRDSPNVVNNLWSNRYYSCC